MALLLVLGACVQRGASPGGHPHRHAAPPATAEREPPRRVSLVKLVSWAEPSAGRCSTDLEGSAPPARFTLRYREDGGEPVVIENEVDDLFAAGWSIVSRSERGYGFEKAGEFADIDFDIVEELQCRCEGARPENHLLNARIRWKAGGQPQVTATIGGEEVRPVIVTGRLALYELRFIRRFPVKGGGECASRLLAALELSDPIE